MRPHYRHSVNAMGQRSEGSFFYVWKLMHEKQVKQRGCCMKSSRARNVFCEEGTPRTNADINATVRIHDFEARVFKSSIQPMMGIWVI